MKSTAHTGILSFHCSGACHRSLARDAAPARAGTTGSSLEVAWRIPARRCGNSLPTLVSLLCAVAVGCLQPVGAEEKPCVGRILEFEPGKIRIRNSDGDSVRIEASRLPTPLCVLEMVTDKPQYRVHVPDGKWKGEWFVKRRKVARTDTSLNVDCAPFRVTSKVEIRTEPKGGTRAIGEEPCD